MVGMGSYLNLSRIIVRQLSYGGTGDEKFITANGHIWETCHTQYIPFDRNVTGLTVAKRSEFKP